MEKENNMKEIDVRVVISLGNTYIKKYPLDTYKVVLCADAKHLDGSERHIKMFDVLDETDRIVFYTITGNDLRIEYYKLLKHLKVNKLEAIDKRIKELENE